MKRVLLTVLIAIVLTSLTAGHSFANYALISNEFSNFSVSGSGFAGFTPFSGPFNPTFTRAGNTTNLGADPAQATAGSGPFPPENSFAARGPSATFSRADSQPLPFVSGTAHSVAEVSGPGLAWAFINIPFGVKQIEGQQLTFSFSVDPHMFASSSTGSVEAHFVLTLQIMDETTGQHLTWNPGNTNVFGSIFQRGDAPWNASEVVPFAVTHSLTPEGGSELHDPEQGDFALTINTLNDHDLEVLLTISSFVSIVVPEPPSIALFSLAIIALLSYRLQKSRISVV